MAHIEGNQIVGGCDFCGADLRSNSVYIDEFDNTVCKKCYDDHAFAKNVEEVQKLDEIEKNLGIKRII